MPFDCQYVSVLKWSRQGSAKGLRYIKLLHQLSGMTSRLIKEEIPDDPFDQSLRYHKIPVISQLLDTVTRFRGTN